jgi:hypothetical protein
VPQPRVDGPKVSSWNCCRMCFNSMQVPLVEQLQNHYAKLVGAANNLVV